MRIICVHVCIYYTKIVITLAVFMLSLTIFASKKITDSCSTNSQLMYRRHIYVPKTLRCMSQNTLLYVHFKTAIQNYMHIYYVCLYTARVLYLDTRSLYHPIAEKPLIFATCRSFIYKASSVSNSHFHPRNERTQLQIGHHPQNNFYHTTVHSIV